MALDRSSPSEYLVGHIEDALARDPRVAEQGLHVEVPTSETESETIVVVSGTVTSAQHKDHIIELIAELMPGTRISDRTTVADYGENGEVEEVP